jgi:putative ABC transport system substrate-binding protein
LIGRLEEKRSLVAWPPPDASTQADDRLIDAVRQGLKDAGYIEGRNLAIKYRSADGRFDRLPSLAAEMVTDHVEAIIALSPPDADILEHKRWSE